MPTTTRHQHAEDERKFRELILYISQKCADDPTFGATKLNKILYFSDFYHYGNTGSPITGFEYQKLPNGPCPRKLLPIRAKMLKEGILGIQAKSLRNGNIQHRTVNLRRPDLSVFSAEEIAQVDQVIEGLAMANAETASELSHRMMGWIVARDNETIPYATVFLSSQPLTAEDKQRGLRFAKSHNLVIA
ncbi:MAG: type II toxin-antitoxin system antitoxin SocA domain-containing protein [Bryobacteraceae bacterium]|jgi:hypothetical protein